MAAGGESAVAPRCSALIFLVGLSGSGKTTVGHLLADQLGLPFLDTDAEIERRTGCAVPQIFESAGEPAFRALEREVVAAACSLNAGVVATGGGAPLDGQSRQAMRDAGVVLWLDAPDDELAARLASGGDADRPLLSGGVGASLARLREQRQAAYSQAGAKISASGTPNEIVQRILAALDRDRIQLLGTSSEPITPVWVRTPTRTYPVYVGSGVSGQAAALMRGQDLEGRLRIIADQRVAEIHGGRLRDALADLPQTWYEVPAGEQHKTLRQAEQLYDALLADGPERGDILIALGGGVVGDLAGFVAATLLRGVRYIQIPTTVLSQVDSSVGGKVGVDHPRGKNLIGAFHHPSLVIADVDLLRTLPAREVAAGWAEVVKIAVVQDAALFEQLERSVQALGNLELAATTGAIRRAVELKAHLVEADERDVTGSRAALNYGHTLGHALEAATSYATLLHGEAVAVGMAGAAHIAHAMGLHPKDAVVRQSQLLQRLGLPQRYEGLSRTRLEAALGLDKKRVGGQAMWVLPAGLGSVRMRSDVPQRILQDALDLITGQHEA